MLSPNVALKLITNKAPEAAKRRISRHRNWLKRNSPVQAPDAAYAKAAVVSGKVRGVRHNRGSIGSNFTGYFRVLRR